LNGMKITFKHYVKVATEVKPQSNLQKEC